MLNKASHKSVALARHPVVLLPLGGPIGENEQITDECHL